MKKRSGKSQKRTAKTKRTQERSGRVCAHNLLPINAPGSGDPLGRNHEHPDSSGDRQVAANGMGEWKKITQPAEVAGQCEIDLLNSAGTRGCDHKTREPVIAWRRAPESVRGAMEAADDIRRERESE